MIGGGVCLSGAYVHVKLFNGTFVLFALLTRTQVYCGAVSLFEVNAQVSGFKSRVLAQTLYSS